MIPGDYVLVSRQGYEELLLAMDFPAGMVSSYVLPENKSTATFSKNEDGSYTYTQCNPKIPEINETSTFKIGEEWTSEKPMPCKNLITKIGDNKYMITSKFGKNTSESTVCFNNYGFHVSSYIQGKGVTGTEIYKKVEPCINGYYVMVSEKNAVNVFLDSVPEDKKEAAKAMFKDVSLRFRRNGNQICWSQRYGDYTKSQTVTLDQQFKDVEPGLGMETTNLLTETGPGQFKVISKNDKTGQTLEIDTTFTNEGCYEKGVDKKTGKTFEICYSRGFDMEGKWKTVAVSNMNTYLEMLEIPEPMKTEILNERPTHCVCRLPGGLISVKSSSKMYPDYTFKFGEEFSVDLPGGMGSFKGLVTEGKDEMISVMKFGNKTLSSKQRASGDFLITEVEVNGNMASRAKMIDVRE